MTFKADLVLPVRVREQPIPIFVHRRVELPFVPVPGMQFAHHDEGWDGFEVEIVQWDLDLQEFYVQAETTQSGQKPWQTKADVIADLRAMGWTFEA